MNDNQINLNDIREELAENRAKYGTTLTADEIYPTPFRNCPCCGGTAKVQDTALWLTPAVFILCTSCGLQTARVLIDNPKLGPNGLDESTRYTREQAIQIAAAKWNVRVK